VEELLHEPVISTEAHSDQYLTAFEKEIAVHNLSFRYGEHYVLKNINLTIPKGKTVALVGKSGSGKTTLADLICRFYDPTEGMITIDGHDIRSFNASSIRKMMGVVSQEAILFNDTVFNNIAYSDEPFSEEDIRHAAQIANAHEFIMKMENGYHSIIGERGTRLSGGQRQRLSIARAVLRNPPILVLDEATSALDTHSEREVQQALDRLMKDRTCIIIAHRLSTITHADLIVVLDQGEIIEQGTHAELLARKGAYFQLYSQQI
jgi:subfamily B ATP-binding cassette protein MsbA